MFRNHSATDSINQYYHSNVERAPLTPHTPLRPVEEKGNYGVRLVLKSLVYNSSSKGPENISGERERRRERCLLAIA
ncbi:hypothetical protein D4764_09G0002310 [Takifugu flavidus]|uniref:Uncharacterized protein n=1 Tax=Takifugu flavidus TaxID=433684 RepID=A0A5C6MJ98_9TELE|nr:hypothetical protein D4764_09G0002310 [Takifugu flavidus]